VKQFAQMSTTVGIEGAGKAAAPSFLTLDRAHSDRSSGGFPIPHCDLPHDGQLPAAPFSLKNLSKSVGVIMVPFKEKLTKRQFLDSL
jgi:hypothetical protein